MVDIQDIRAAAADALIAEYRDNITEADNSDRILHYMEVVGASWDYEDGFQTDDYWCGYAVGYAYRTLGEHLVEGQCLNVAIREEIAKYCMGSTSRLAGMLGDGEPWSKFDFPPFEKVTPSEIEKGDIPVVATGRTTREWGDHITLATGPVDLSGDIPIYPTVEGNVSDTIVTRERTPEETAAVYRPRDIHFEDPNGILSQ